MKVKINSTQKSYHFYVSQLNFNYLSKIMDIELNFFLTNIFVLTFLFIIKSN